MGDACPTEPALQAQRLQGNQPRALSTAETSFKLLVVGMLCPLFRPFFRGV